MSWSVLSERSRDYWKTALKESLRLGQNWEHNYTVQKKVDEINVRYHRKEVLKELLSFGLSQEHQSIVQKKAEQIRVR